MKWMTSLFAVTLVSSAVGSALAQEGEDTLVLMPEGAELPDAVLKTIELPKDENGNYIASAKGVENSEKGLATANAAREDGRTFGQEMAAAAREDHSRGQRPDLSDLRPNNVPDDAALPTPPDRPERPDLPETPANPAGH